METVAAWRRVGPGLLALGHWSSGGHRQGHLEVSEVGTSVVVENAVVEAVAKGGLVRDLEPEKWCSHGESCEVEDAEGAAGVERKLLGQSVEEKPDSAGRG